MRIFSDDTYNLRKQNDMEHIAVLQRVKSNKVQTLGDFSLSLDGHELFFCNTLELPERENRRSISRIPAGEYKVTVRTSRKFGAHFLVNNVEGREYILLHRGNYHYQTRGCIIMGKGYKDIDGDGNIDILESKNTLGHIIGITAKFKLIIKDEQ